METASVDSANEGPLLHEAAREEARIRRCAVDPNYPTQFERGVVIHELDGDAYAQKTAATAFAVIDHLRQALLRHAVEGP